MTTANTNTTTGLSVILRALMLVLLIALIVPALAMADETSGAVLDPPATESPAAEQPAPEATPPATEAPPVAEETTPPANQTPEQPVDQSPVGDSDPAPATPPATTPDPVATDPTPVEPPASEVIPTLPVITIPAVPVVDGILTTIPELIATPALPPEETAVKLAPVILMPPSNADTVPAVKIAAAPAGNSVTPLATAVTLPTGTDTPFAPLAADTGAVTPSQATTAGILTSAAALPQNLFSLDPNRSRAVTPPPTAESAAGVPLAGAIADPSLFSETAIAAVGGVQSGTSLLSVLAGYVLPGVGGPPATSMIMFILVGLIVGLAFAPRPQLSERLHLGGLLGARSGHTLVVCRPG